MWWAISPNRAGSCMGRKRLRWMVWAVLPIMTSSPVVGAPAMKISHFSREAIVFPERIAPSQHEILDVDSATDRICLRDNGSDSSTAQSSASSTGGVSWSSSRSEEHTSELQSREKLV